MGLKKYKPATPSLRFTILPTNDEITKRSPERSRIVSLRRTGGRNAQGRITVRHRGGGQKRKYRRIDFCRDKHSIPAKVAAIEYDPGRSAYIALLHYKDGEKRYILAPHGIRVGDVVMSGNDVDPVVGNAMPLAKVPIGAFVHNVELVPGQGGTLARSAGNSAQLLAREGRYAHLRLPSGEVRMVNINCMATIGQVSNPDHFAVSYGKAGRTRWRGIRPTVRGVAMNPVDHPMGGGEGRTSGGGHPRSPWGKLAKGGLTRPVRKPSTKFIVSRRK